MRGEGSLFYADSVKSRPQFVASLSVDYMFSRQVRIVLGGLYNSSGTKSLVQGFATLLNDRISAKRLSDARYQVLLQIGYPVTPLVTVDCSVLLNPLDGSVLIFPHASFSLSENVEVIFQAQVQAGKKTAQFGGKEHAVYGSFRWSF